jgi:hypothetical protein
MAFGVPPFAPTGTNGRRRSNATPPPIAAPPNPDYASTTTTTAPPPTTPPPSPVPTGTIPTGPAVPNSPTNPNLPVRPAAGPPYQGQFPPVYQVPMIPYENNALIPPSEWAKRYPGSPFPTDHVSPQDAQTVMLDQYMLDLAGQKTASQTAADQLAGQYDAWLRSTQGRALGQLTGGIGTATAINDLNNKALYQSGGNQLALNIEQLVRNKLDQQGIAASDQQIKSTLGLAAEQLHADTARIKGQWQLRNGQFVSDQDYIRGVWGRATEQYGADQAQSAALADQARLGYGYAAADLENSVNRTNLQEGANRRAATSDAAGRGAFGSSGFRENVADIGELAELNRDSAWNQYEQVRDNVTGQLRDIDYGRGNLDRRLQGDIAGFQKQLGDNERNYQGDILNYQYGIGQANRDFRQTAASVDKALQDNRLAAQGLDSMARSLGIQNRDIIQTMNTAAQRNNINLSQVIADMNTAYQQGDADRIFQFQQFITNLMGMGTAPTGTTSTRVGTVNPRIS